MRIVKLEKATRSLADYARRVATEPVVVTAAGKPVAALVSVSGADMENLALSKNPQLLSILKRSWNRIKTEGSISSAEMRRRIQSNR